ncbi:hypothetical protein SCLCIDRAFT_31824 [Scleroderma citrinum Foug A]|uniref:Uncharacterized protein n=1 Tax=Scleroderma citrinum Foug A TaxID=1036808 RepID=A0A0C2ZLP8_9AGAM|nr:hypothetical protein SCLCIDRAFT_31824 [Scleroderma citrinum Foug A]
MPDNSDNERHGPYHDLVEWLATLDVPSRFPVPQVVLSAARIFREHNLLHSPADRSTISCDKLICEYLHMYTEHDESHYWISLVLETWHPVANSDIPPPRWIREGIAECITLVKPAWEVVPLFSALAFHESDNFAKRAAILHWTARYERALFNCSILALPKVYWQDEDGLLVVY